MSAGTNLAIPENHLSDTESRWFAVYTRFKSEKEVARRLSKKGIECYVPINRVVRQYKRKRKIVDLPLINCYVFVHIRKRQYIPVLETEFVSRFIHFSKNLISIPASEIDMLKRICQEATDIQADGIKFEKGKSVEIISGNLTGIQGKLLNDLGRNFLVELQYIGIGLRIEIDPKLLQPLPAWQSSHDEPPQVQALGKKYWG